MPSKKQKESIKETRSKEKQDKVSLAPLSVEEAMADLLRIPKPAKEKERKADPK